MSLLLLFNQASAPARHRRTVRPIFAPIIIGRTKRRPIAGSGPQSSEYEQIYTQFFRVADSTVDLYELYVGEDAAPDFGMPPAATSATLPFSYTPTPPGAGTKVLHLVCRRTNAFGLQSFNVWEKQITIDTGSNAVNPITPPLEVAVYDDVTTYIRVVAKYVSLDDPDPADTWEVFVTEGSDPDPTVDVPAFSGLMTLMGVEARMTEVVGPYTAGAVAHVIVTATRAADGEQGSAPVVLKTLAVLLDLSDGQMFGGSVYEQR